MNFNIKFGDVVKLQDKHHYLCLSRNTFLRLENVTTEVVIVSDNYDNQIIEHFGNMAHLPLNDIVAMFND